ncbi:hypothetical protein ACX122_06935 [Kosakonia cowanii]
MTAQLSRERLEKIASWREKFGADHNVMLPAEEAEAMARMLLAGMNSKPVAWLLSGGGAKNHVSFDSGNAYADPLREVTPLYTVQPAPVAVPDEISTADAMRIMNGRVITMSVHTAYKNGWNACRAAMLNAGPVTAATVPEKCWCRTCRPVGITDMRFVVCPDCGNKRCPRANDHRNACSGSNEPGQVGSAYPAAPEQEV